MMVKNVICLILTFFIGFTQGCFTHREESFVDSTFDPYIKDFEHITGRDVSLANIKFMSLPKGEIGKCYMITKDMYIDPVYWSNASPIKKRSLVYHELAHCVCDSRHDKREYKNGCPKSILSPTEEPTYCLFRYWKSYIKDIQKKCQK
jgi:hypothetical protein